MEFSHVGSHCESEGCRQQDFLPFKCHSCGKNLCLMHRSQVSHDCIAPTIDMTSVDCPICGKSFKFNKTNDPNLEWDRHLATSCSQQPETQNNRIKCQAPQCNVVLGPSNKITCNQCHRQVCLSHRIPDQHNCKELRRADTLRSKGQQSSHLTPKGQQSSQSAARQPSRQQASEARPSRLSQSTDSTNTLKGSATRRQQQQPHVTAPAPPLLEPCPMCGARFPDAVSLANHFEQSHSSENQTHSSPPPQRSGPIETCPQCGRVFADVLQLVHHVEIEHHTTANPAAPSPPTDSCHAS